MRSRSIPSGPRAARQRSHPGSAPARRARSSRRSSASRMRASSACELPLQRPHLRVGVRADAGLGLPRRDRRRAGRRPRRATARRAGARAPPRRANTIRRRPSPAPASAALSAAAGAAGGRFDPRLAAAAGHAGEVFVGVDARPARPSSPAPPPPARREQAHRGRPEEPGPFRHRERPFRRGWGGENGREARRKRSTCVRRLSKFMTSSRRPTKPGGLPRARVRHRRPAGGADPRPARPGARRHQGPADREQHRLRAGRGGGGDGRRRRHRACTSTTPSRRARGSSPRRRRACWWRKGPERIRELASWGARFDREAGRLHFTREGAHSRNRVLHALGDATGWEMVRVAAGQDAAARPPSACCPSPARSTS